MHFSNKGRRKRIQKKAAIANIFVAICDEIENCKQFCRLDFKSPAFQVYPENMTFDYKVWFMEKRANSNDVILDQKNDVWDFVTDNLRNAETYGFWRFYKEIRKL